MLRGNFELVLRGAGTRRGAPTRPQGPAQGASVTTGLCCPLCDALVVDRGAPAEGKCRVATQRLGQGFEVAAQLAPDHFIPGKISDDPRWGFALIGSAGVAWCRHVAGLTDLADRALSA